MENKTAGGLIVLLAIVALGWFVLRGPNWSLFYYPNGNLSSPYTIERINAYKSQDECMQAGEDMQASFPERGDTFECGDNCRPSGDPINGVQSYECDNTYD